MIGIDGSYVFKFSIADKTDFIFTEDLQKFEIIEEAGTTLPTWLLIFRTSEPNIMRYFNEGNILNVSYGKDIENVENVDLMVSSFTYTNKGSDYKLVTLKGLLNKTTFLHKPIKNITEKISGVEAIISRLNKSFKVDTNITKSSDLQYWLQPNISDKSFVNNTWFHCYIPNSFLAMGITTNGTYIIRDMVKKIKDIDSGYDWKFTGKPTDSKSISHNGKDLEFSSDFTFMNYIMGYKKEKYIHSLSEPTSQLISEELKPIISLTNKLVRNVEIESRFSEVSVQDDNVHSNYWKAYLRNLSSLILFSTVKVEFNFAGEFRPIKLLDLIMFEDYDVSSDKSNLSEEFSGKYFVTKVARTLTGGQFYTTVLACRESINSVSGNIA